MPELPEPTRVDRPLPVARWRVDVPAHGYLTVCREGATVTLGGCDGRPKLTLDAASNLGAAITAAAQWTDDTVVDAEIVDDRPRIEYRWVIEALVATRPPWLTDTAARKLAEDVAGWLAHCTPVVVVRDGTEWAP